jgi:hypothetical protein
MRFRVGEEAPAGRMSNEPTHAVFAIKERQHAGSVHSRKTGVESRSETGRGQLEPKPALVKEIAAVLEIK